MRVRSAAVALCTVALAALTSGCGSAGPVTTGTIAVGTTVSQEQYLADTRAAAGAIRDFAAVVNGLPNPLTREALTEAAGAMADPLARAEAVQTRLVAERLEDQRLESQRGKVRTANAAVIAGMGRMRNAAQAGDMPGAKQAAADLQASVEALRAIGVGGT